MRFTHEKKPPENQILSSTNSAARPAFLVKIFGRNFFFSKQTITDLLWQHQLYRDDRLIKILLESIIDLRKKLFPQTTISISIYENALFSRTFVCNTFDRLGQTTRS